MPIVETHAIPIVQNHENHSVVEHAKHRPLCPFMPIRNFGAHLEILAHPTSKFLMGTMACSLILPLFSPLTKAQGRVFLGVADLTWGYMTIM